MSEPEKILIKNGRCVNANREFISDVYIENGRIKEVAESISLPVAEANCRVIDAAGQYVMPGGIDTHTHMSLRFMGTEACDDFYSGTRAAIAGGTTMIMDFAVTDSPQDSLLSGYDRYREMGDTQACCDYALHMAVTGWRPGSTELEMKELVDNRGINSFKCFMAYKDSLMLRDPELISVFETCRKYGALAMVHAENGDVIDHLQQKILKMGITGPEGHLYSRPEQVEAEATQRAIMIANQINCPLYVVHVMSKSAANVIQRERSESNCIVFGETLASAIGTDGTHQMNRCWRHAAGHVMAPPLRPDPTTSEKLLNLLANSDLHTVGSDHCVFNSQQKALGARDFSKIPNGCNGVEERLMVLWERAVQTGKMSPSQFVAATSTNAARIFNIYPQKGHIAVGSDADIVIWGPRPKVIRAESHHSQVDFNVFEGFQASHSPIFVISRGRVVLDESGLQAVRGAGKFVPTPPYAQFVYATVNQRELNKPPVIDRSPETIPAVNLQINGSYETKKSANDTTERNASPQNVNGQPAMDEPKNKSNGSGRGYLTPAAMAAAENARNSIRVHNNPGGRSSGIW